MKTLINFKVIAIIMLLSMAFYSCSEDELATTDNQEEFRSTTANSTELESFEDAVELEGEVLFSKTYDEDLTPEEASALFDKDVQQYLKDNPQVPQKALSTEWVYNVGFRTGSQSYNTTNGTVQSRVYFKTNRGTSWMAYNHPSGAASRAGYHYEYRKGWYPGRAPVSYVKPVGHRIGMRGTDGWFVTFMAVTMAGIHQTIPASGLAGLQKYPYVWLDSSSSNAWDFYYSSAGQWGGKITF